MAKLARTGVPAEPGFMAFIGYVRGDGSTELSYSAYDLTQAQLAEFAAEFDDLARQLREKSRGAP
jgi:molybdopterin synthase catalytic subunit